MGQEPRVGVGVLVFKEGKLLLGQRKNVHGDGEWCGPGGHLEFGETIEECAARETMEEAGLEIENVRVLTLATLLWPNKHYIDIAVVADWKTGEPELREPDKRSHWEWYEEYEIPEQLFGSTREGLEALKTGKFYFGTKKFA